MIGSRPALYTNGWFNPISRGDKRTSSEPLDMLFDDRDLERTSHKANQLQGLVEWKR